MFKKTLAVGAETQGRHSGAQGVTIRTVQRLQTRLGPGVEAKAVVQQQQRQQHQPGVCVASSDSSWLDVRRHVGI